MTDIVCLGEPMIEFNQVPNGSWIQGFGGDTSNCAISAARQGAMAGYLTKLGDDHFGDRLIELWESEGIDTSHVIRDPDSPTGIYFVTHDENGHHFTYYRKHSAASTITPSELPADYITEAKILHVSAISQAISDSAAETVQAAIEIANGGQTKVAYDTNLRLNLWPEDRARAVIHEAMQHCHIALPSYDDAVVLTKLQEPDDIVDFYLKLGAEIVVLKRSHEGAIVATQQQREKIEGIEVNSFIDANGAGDTFAGAFLSQLAANKNPFDAARYANAAAALSTQSEGAVSAIPHRERVEAFFAK